MGRGQTWQQTKLSGSRRENMSPVGWCRRCFKGVFFRGRVFKGVLGEIWVFKYLPWYLWYYYCISSFAPKYYHAGMRIPLLSDQKYVDMKISGWFFACPLRLRACPIELLNYGMEKVCLELIEIANARLRKVRTEQLLVGCSLFTLRSVL